MTATPSSQAEVEKPTVDMRMTGMILSSMRTHSEFHERAKSAKALSALTQARVLMREASDLISFRIVRGIYGKGTVCDACNTLIVPSDVDAEKPEPHKPDCLVTKLRMAADDAEGRDNAQ